MALVLFIQAFFLGDGGINALGANVLNMAVLGAGAGGAIMLVMQARGISKNISIGMAAFISVVLTALLCTVEVASSDSINFGIMLKSMMSVYVLIAGVEGILTVALYHILSKVLSRAQGHVLSLRLALCCLIALAFLPFASHLPDGLDNVSTHIKDIL